MLKSTMVFAVLLIAAGSASAGHGVRDYLKRSAAWYAGDEAKTVAANVLSWQSDLGGWPKNVDTATRPYQGQNRAKELAPTFDNDATTDELRLLARVFNATQTPRYQAAFLKGYDYILKAQYPTGGWPQFYPPGKHYHRHITFNDDAMVRLMEFVRVVDVARLRFPRRVAKERRPQSVRRRHPMYSEMPDSRRWQTHRLGAPSMTKRRTLHVPVAPTS